MGRVQVDGLLVLSLVSPMGPLVSLVVSNYSTCLMLFALHPSSSQLDVGFLGDIHATVIRLEE